MSDDVMGRISQLEKSCRNWKMLGFASIGAVGILLVVTVYNCSAQQQKKVADQPGKGFATETSLQMTTYANFFTVNVTPEELVLDCGLNTETEVKPNRPIKLTNRLVMSWFTAKRLLGALQGTVQQHENTYGPLELDFQKRMRKQP